MPAITMQMSRSCVDPPFLPQPPLDFSLPPHTLTELKELQSYLGSFLTGGGLHWTLRNGREAVALFVYRIFNWDFPDLAQLNAAKQLLFGSSQLMAASPCK